MAPIIFLGISILSALCPSCSASSSPMPPATNATGRRNDLAALLAFQAQLSDPTGVLATSWRTNVSFCRWIGVSCNHHRRQRVTALSLTDVLLQGELSPHLGNLSFLSMLNLVNTGLTGHIPAELGMLSRLKVLSLFDNGLTGPIPCNIGNLTKLEDLRLSYNRLTYEIPLGLLRNMHSLKILYLARNELTGQIPPYLFNNTQSLRGISLSNNSLSGPLPHNLGSLPMLEFLNLEVNNLLSGTVPTTIYNMSRLRWLYLSGNNFTGPFPTNQSFSLPLLKELSIAQNNFVGSIPSGLAACKYLETLDLQENYFVDVIPTWLAQLPCLTALALGVNNLVGSIPSVLSNLTHLTVLTLLFNQLTGPIPAFLGNFSKLSMISLGANQFSGPVPATLGDIPVLGQLGLGSNNLDGNLNFLSSLSNCRKLQVIDLSNNSFIGGLPDHTGNLSTELISFAADSNKLTGKLPSTLSNLSRLEALNLYNNLFTGEIPKTITMMQELVALDVTDNDLSGSIPTSIGMLRSLQQFWLQGNKFFGSIPESIGNLSLLEQISLSSNQLNSSIPASLFHLDKLTILDLSSNFFVGPLPSDVGSLKQVVYIDLSSNFFNGTIPESFGQIVMLNFLNLSHNSFDGPIPDSFRMLTSLSYLDLSFNNISGTIPMFLANFTDLTTLNLSFNKLQGKIPDGGVFSNITSKCLIGNGGLCGSPHLGFSPCLEGSHSNKRNLLIFLLPVVTVAFSSIVLCVYIMITRKAKTKRDDGAFVIDPANPVRQRLFSYRELILATDNFSPNNLLGTGSSAKVFKGPLSNGLVVAIKVLDTRLEHAITSFDAECHVLRIARHRNLIKILSTCSNQDFRALVLQYMPNGSLDKLLHSEVTTSSLGFLKRLEIMLDVSMAMEYLHHQHFQVVLHCDLKPTNVLFDSDMTAHVTDFGIAKFLSGDDSSMVTASMPGTLGYMAPEYGSFGKASRKSDVFSFGIMLLEVFIGKKPTDPMFIGDLSIREWVRQAFLSEIVDALDDKLLQGPPFADCDLKPFVPPIFELGLLCSTDAPDQRLSMSDVVVVLKKVKNDYIKSLPATRPEAAQ
ncbi:putative receptor-like protein kinase At3g47110 isoform X1 [Sorghum bicolor]|uniref:putative receptor-like protein kinase At3g47110 isoform X1 n=1 Tax=Sorghum bicolor TaxID=4558 RepID=UPI0001A88039|nr:putative receptor-like protein kinase At3g47110 isoform X1 [Sorghum bicolor]|eukprot:XP_002442957.1 putative receptor-like protein kinase At3g47110 isoform X1 [Sorghum bicolor]